MSFKILRVTERAHGGDPIERVKVIEGKEVSIGRGTDCDLQLPDLSVGLRHATMKAVDRGRVVVEAIGDQTFEVNGKVVRQAEIRVSDKPQITFGTYLLTFAMGDTPDQIVVTVTQMADVSAPTDSMLTKQAFSLSTIMYSLRGCAWVLVFLIVAGALAAPVTYYYLTPKPPTIDPTQQWSSGPLSSGHAFLNHNCEACHAQAFRSIPDSACLTCHRNDIDAIARVKIAERTKAMGAAYSPDPVGDHANPELLFKARGPEAVNPNPAIAAFQNIFGHPTSACTSCHTEHVGLAGQKPPADTPAHPTIAQVREADCESCHAHLKARLPDTALLDVASWTEHPDFRPLIATLGQRGRPRAEDDSIADGPFDTGLNFSHKQHLAAGGEVFNQATKNNKPLSRDGTRMSCAACHHSDSSGRGFLPIDMPRDCSACHSLAVPGIRNGDQEVLPHGQPEKVVGYYLQFYASGGGVAPAYNRPGAIPGFHATSQSYSQDQIDARIRAVFMGTGAGAHPCADCHKFAAPADPQSHDYKLQRPVLLVDRYLPRAGFDHSVPAHNRDASGNPNCATCHTATTSDNLSNIVIPGIQTCKACHGAANPKSNVAADSNCTECHGYHRDDMGDPPTEEVYRGPWKLPDGS